MKVRKKDIANALKDTFNEGVAGAYWTDEEQYAEGWWSIEGFPECAVGSEKPHQFWVGDFLVTVSKPRKPND